LAALIVVGLKEVAPQDFAEQLTLIDQEIFEQVSAADLLIWATVPVERATKAPRLSVFIEKYNEVMMWVVSAIVCEPEQQERTALIRRFIDIAAALQDIGSFNLFCAIMAGLTHPCITFLNGSWTAVIDPHKTTFDTLKAATSSDGHYKNLATQMSLFKGPYIPFLGGYISDIQKIHESEQTKTKQGDLEIINYGKLRRLFDVASTIRQSRNAGAYIAKPCVISLLNLFFRWFLV
jgi:son of sevenless-like protein